MPASSNTSINCGIAIPIPEVRHVLASCNLALWIELGNTNWVRTNLGYQKEGVGLWWSHNSVRIPKVLTKHDLEVYVKRASKDMPKESQ